MSRAFICLLILTFLVGCSLPASSTAQPDPATPTEPVAPPPVTPTGTASVEAATVSPTVTPTALSTEAGRPDAWIAFLDETGNLALVDAFSGAQLTLTEDAVPYSIETAEAATIAYCCAAWSTDGRYLSFWQESGTPATSGYRYVYRLQVLEVASRKIATLLEDEVISGYDWRPNSHEITIDRPIPPDYFLENRKELATGIDVIDIRTGERQSLVAPENGYALAGPQWSPDGRLLTFTEIQFMEGGGQFAWYDFTTGRYHSTGEVLGETSLSPDGESIAFDRLAYLPTGEEQIWVRSLSGEEAQQVSTGLEGEAYAFSPHYSPDGDKIAYFVAQDGPEVAKVILCVFSIRSGDTMDLGEFEQAGSLGWSPDGRFVVLAAGRDKNRTVFVVDIEKGRTTELVHGSAPVWQPTGSLDLREPG